MPLFQLFLLGKRAAGYLCLNLSDRGGLPQFLSIKVPNVKCLKSAGLVTDLHKEGAGIEYFLVK